MAQRYADDLIAGQLAGSRFALAAPTRVPLGMAGTQLGARAGSSLEFKEHREYQPGDDLRRIDWAAYARSDRLHIKLNREEVNPHCDLLLDGSASMGLADSKKPNAAVALCAALAEAATNAAFSRNVFLAADGCDPVPGATGAAAGWGALSFDAATTLEEAVLRLPPAVKPRSVRFVISDLLWLGDPLAVLQPLAHEAARVVVVQLLARDDAEPPPHGSLRITDAETGERRQVFIDASAQKRYRAALADHQQQWADACTQVGAVMTTVIAEDLLERWYLSDLVAREVLKVV